MESEPVVNEQRNGTFSGARQVTTINRCRDSAGDGAEFVTVGTWDGGPDSDATPSTITGLDQDVQGASGHRYRHLVLRFVGVRWRNLDPNAA